MEKYSCGMDWLPVVRYSLWSSAPLLDSYRLIICFTLQLLALFLVIFLLVCFLYFVVNFCPLDFIVITKAPVVLNIERGFCWKVNRWECCQRSEQSYWIFPYSKTTMVGLREYRVLKAGRKPDSFCGPDS